MTNTKPKLDENISPEDLTDFYWLKSELQEFCREAGLSTAGGKIEITERIKHFLKTGKKLKLAIAPPGAKRPSATAEIEYKLDTKVGTGFRCTREIRDFFESQVGPHFHFSVQLQKYIKANPELTFQGVIHEWQRLENLKASGKLDAEIGPQFEYNQFTRDFFSDPKNQGKTRKECISAWKEICSKRGERKYRP